VSLLASIPSPAHGTISLGPLTVHMYGLMLLAGIVACIWLTGRRYIAHGGDWDLILRVAVWGVGFGVVGARLYHIVTSWSEVPNPKWKGVFEVWQGGLGIWGGVLFGVLAGAWIVHREGRSVALLLDVVAPGLLLAQAIGRIGNWWNQELFGKPTTLPWGLEIDQAHRPAGYLQYSTFHPTFLYELLWDGLGVLVLVWIDRRFRIRRPGLFALYVAWYCTFRSYEEVLRIDPGSHYYLGMRLNFYVSVGVFLIASGFFLWWQKPWRRRAREPKRPAMAVPKGRVRHGR
jgi:prolipoprotein diacylglyceryl transferase